MSNPLRNHAQQLPLDRLAAGTRPPGRPVARYQRPLPARGGDLAPASAAEAATAVAAGAPEAATSRAASPATAAGAQAAIAMVPVATAGAPAAVTEGGREGGRGAAAVGGQEE